MSANRFFFRCASCFFRFSADVEGLRAPQVGACVVCGASWVRCLGATKGVLSIGVPCNDVCVFAEGPDCSCSCGGKNHGSRLLVPVVRNVVDFSGRKFPRVDEARIKWEWWQAQLRALETAHPAEVLADRVKTSRYNLGTIALASEYQSWPAREKALLAFKLLWGVVRVPSIGSGAIGSCVGRQLSLF